MFAVVARDTSRTPWDYSRSRNVGFGNVGVSESLLRGHLAHMVRDFEHESRLRIPRGSLSEKITKASGGDSPETAPDATALMAAWTTFPAVSFATNAADKPVAVVMHGHISNANEIRELYGLPPADPLPATAAAPASNEENNQMPPPPPASPNIEGAQLILELYGRRFEDKDGDPSDQPATALTACEGSFSFVLIDSERDAVLVARSAESDTHPLYWGTAPSSYSSPASEEQGGTDADADTAPAPDDDEWDGSLLLSSDLAAIDGPCGGAAVAFPLGAFYYCDDAMDVGAIQRLSMSASRAKRRVQPLHRVNSSGQVCGLGFYTESGNDLASLAHKYIS